MNRRDRGYTLIEMLIVIALLSVMVILATMTLAILMRSERAGGDALVAAQAGHRLARQFRDDVHAAHDATVDSTNPARPVLSLLSGDGRVTVTWRRVEAGLRRTVAGEPTHIETYRVPATEVSFALSPHQPAAPPRRLVSLTTVPGTETANRPHAVETWPIRVTAVLGREATP